MLLAVCAHCLKRMVDTAPVLGSVDSGFDCAGVSVPGHGSRLTAPMQLPWIVKQVFMAVAGIAGLYGSALVFLMYMPRLGCGPSVFNQ